jgi:hypothetical protein
MAITTLDQLITGFNVQKSRLAHKISSTGVANYPILLHRVRGTPGAAVAPASGLTGATLSGPVSGQILVNNPASGSKHLSTLFSHATVPCSILMADLLWENSGIVVTTTTAQTINSIAFPARDIAGTTLGDGVLVGLECTTANTNAALIAGMTINYTNQAGVAGRTGTMAQSWPALCPVNIFVPFGLQAGDQGVRSIQSITLGTSLLTGSVSLVAYRPLTLVNLPSGFGGNEDAIQNGMPLLFNNTVLSAITIPTVSTAGNFYIHVGFTEG